MSGKINWLAVRTAFVVGGLSISKCAAQFGVDRTTVAKRASREGWTRERDGARRDAAGVVQCEMRDAVVTELRAHAARSNRVLALGDTIARRLQEAMDAAPSSDILTVKALTESYARLADATAKATSTDRLVRGIGDGKASDAGADDRDEPTLVEFRIVNADGSSHGEIDDASTSSVF